MVKILFFFTLLLSLPTISLANPASTLQISRYSTVKQAASPAQINPLRALVQVKMPMQVQTIGDGINTLLRYSGYTLVPAQQQSPALQSVLAKPLPLVDRSLGPLEIQEALIVLVGQGIFTLEQNPLTREINFKLTAYGKRLQSQTVSTPARTLT